LIFDLRGLGRRLPKTEAPAGWVKKIERSREGKVWVGFFHLWTTDIHGRRIRTKKEKTLGPASMPKHEAQEKLADYITEYTGRLTKQGDSISTFGVLWKAFCAVKSGQWSKKTKENLQCLFGKHVVPIIGQQAPREVTLTSLQLLVNKMAEDGYRKSAIGQVRTYIKSCFDYATDEDLIPKSPARKLAMSNIQKKSSERFLSLDEFRSLLSQASPREHLVLRILAVCGLRPANPVLHSGTPESAPAEVLNSFQKKYEPIGTAREAEAIRLSAITVQAGERAEAATPTLSNPDGEGPSARSG
jgi:integrase-like protein